MTSVTEPAREVVTTAVVDSVAVISFNRPEKHNAIDEALSQQWRQALAWAIGDPDARCILVRGEGPSFSSGRDTSQLGERAEGDTDHAYVRRAQDAALAMLDCPKPIVAALKGYVIGGALELALRADLRVAATDVSMRMPEVGYGLVPDTGGTQLLSMLAGPSRAKQMVLTGAAVGAEQALAWGLVNEVVEVDALDERAMELAVTLAQAPPLAVGFAKHLVDEMWKEPVRRGIRSELAVQTALFATDDYREARRARAEGRPPRYEGR